MFVHVTWDDAVLEYLVGKIRPLFDLKAQSNQCPVKTTFYISISAGVGGQILTAPQIVKQLYLSGQEIAIHTFNHLATPSEQEIETARTYLVTNADVPKSEINGYRNPYLKSDATTFKHLTNLGYKYDSTLVSPSKNGFHMYPYTYDYGSPLVCEGLCKEGDIYPGFFEIPMGQLRRPDGQLLTVMDPATSEELDGFDIYLHNFKQRYCTNKAPLGIFLHPAWLLIRDNAVKLQDFVKKVAEFDDVFFVSGSEIVDYMKNPVKASEFTQQCATIGTCYAPQDGCVYGLYSYEECKCKCYTGYDILSDGSCGYCPNGDSTDCEVSNDDSITDGGERREEDESGGENDNETNKDVIQEGEGDGEGDDLNDFIFQDPSDSHNSAASISKPDALITSLFSAIVVYLVV